MMICQLHNAFLMVNLSGTSSGYYFSAIEPSMKLIWNKVISLPDAFWTVSHASDVAHLG